MRDILQSFSKMFQKAGIDGCSEPIVFAAWRRVVEGALGENVVPVRVEGSILTAAVESETWRRQVADLGPMLAEKLNAQLGHKAVSFVRFEVDPQAVMQYRESSGRRAAAPHAPADAATAAPGLAEAAECIRDESLKNIFLAAAASSLARNAGRVAEHE